MSERSTAGAGPGIGSGGGDRWAAGMAEHEGLVVWVVRRQWLGGLPLAEAVQAGRIGLWRALAGFDPARGVRFSSYAVPAIRRAVWAEVAAHRAARVAAPPAAGSGAGARAVGAGWEAEPAAWVERAEAAALVAAMVGDLPPRLRAVVVGRYGLGGAPPATFAALGRRLGVTRQRAQQLAVEALAALAHPARSLALRQWLGRAQRSDYRAALAGRRLRGVPASAGRARRGPRRLAS
jgi:RNA polymerase sigma factor (sigma-70 family)